MVDSQYPVYAICLLALAHQSFGQDTDMQNLTYANRNVTVTGLSIEFRSEPVGRGTVGIILSCVATFLFCIWGTVHPNIIVGAKSHYRLFYKAILMLVAIVVPEGLILSAFFQYWQAKHLHKMWLAKREDKTNEPWYTFLKFWEDSKETFGREGAFFVVMGGFVIKSDNTDQSLDRDKEHNILTYEGFERYIDLIDKNEMRGHRKAILDKGKGSNMAKCLAGLQALWLIVQCFARWKAGLPVTLLEIHVSIQVLCTMIIFFCWWSKPLDVKEHLEITLRGRVGGTSPAMPVPKAVEISEVASAVGEAEASDEGAEASDVRKAEEGLEVELGNLESEEDKLAQSRVGKRGTKRSVNPKGRGQGIIRKMPPPDLTAVTAMAFYDICSCLDNAPKPDLPRGSSGSEKRRNSSEEPEKGSGKKAHWIAMGTEASLVFLTGALHAAAWNFPFANQTGRVLWRLSSVGMCACPTLVVLIASITSYQVDLVTATWEVHLGDRKRYPRGRHLWGAITAAADQILRVASRHGSEIEQSKKTRGRWIRSMTIFHFLLVWFELLLLVAYAVSIITITIISFLSMRHPPVGSFDTPRWNDYWPHF
ncbi:hypothetical protein DFP73DRAFT_96007 [Morchella snyderi]|nr:hypothetical protein DFP73DRAFT_96007 [Morchella snyderi]